MNIRLSPRSWLAMMLVLLVIFIITAPLLTIDPGSRKEATSRLFAGAMIVHTINDYTDRLGITRFDGRRHHVRH